MTTPPLRGDKSPAPSDATPPSFISRTIGRSRYIVVIAVVAVMLVAASLFVLGAIQALVILFQAWSNALTSGQFSTADLTVEFLEIVSAMLKAVVFYIIGIGLYSLFIAPLNLTVALGVESLYDLESKIVSVVIVILGITFLEHFIEWTAPLDTLIFGAALALVVIALVLFQRYTHQAKQDMMLYNPEVQSRAQRELFEQDREEATVEPGQEAGAR
ncbi:MAG: YqhA family protein [Roseiflexaceae bacterium]|nr:YqhA family protein [Roseiflexaceae bacterium]